MENTYYEKIPKKFEPDKCLDRLTKNIDGKQKSHRIQKGITAVFKTTSN